MRIGSLFTGYGGLDMAAQAALGGEPVWHSDIKPAAVELLAHRHPDVPNIGDLTVTFPKDPDQVALPVPPIDALVAGWPCQPHSAAGKRLGEADPRALWPNVTRAIRETRPAIFLGENVARVTGNGELRRVVRSLAEIGYVGAWRCVRASDVGACHRRDRLFIVAIATDTARVGRAEGWTRDARQLRRSNASVGRDGLPDLTLLPTPSASNYGTNQGGAAGRVGPVRESLDTMARNGRFNLLPTPAVADARNTRNATAGRTPANDRHHSGWTLSDVAYASRWGVYAAAIHRHEQVFGRAAPEPTQLSPRTGKPQLAPQFVEWMMCLPEGWVTDVPGLTRNQQLSLLGDGVVPAQAVHAFSGLLAHLFTENAA